MRVMQIVKKLKHGGGETVALRIMEAGTGHEQAVVAAPGEWSERFPGRHFTMGETSLKPQDILAASRRIRAAVKEFRPDVVHAHSPGTIAASALALMGLRGVAFVATCHGGETPERLKVLARAYRLLRPVLVSCGPGVTEGLRAGGLEPAATINNGIPASTVAPETQRALAEEFGLRPEEPVVAAVGRLDPVKNQQQIIRAVARWPHLGVVICGDGSERQSLEALARECGVEDRVIFAGMRRDVLEIMHAAEAVVLVSRVEGLPVTLLEAMAEGTPVVATRVLGTEQLVRDGHNGLLVEVDDDETLAKAFQRLVQEPGLARQLAAGGLETSADYTLESMTQQYWDLYSASLR